MEFDINGMTLSVRAYNLLNTNGIMSIDEILSVGKSGMIMWKGAGIKTVNEIIAEAERIRNEPKRRCHACLGKNVSLSCEWQVYDQSGCLCSLVLYAICGACGCKWKDGQDEINRKCAQ